MSKELMQQALEALEYCIEHSAEIVTNRAKEYGEDSDDLQMMMAEYLEKHRGIITALRVALAEEVSKETTAQPVAWRDPSNTDPGQGCTYDPAVRDKWPHIFTQPLYTPSLVVPQPLTELPPLPDADWALWVQHAYEAPYLSNENGYTADQMRDYGRAVEAEVIKRMQE